MPHRLGGRLECQQCGEVRLDLPPSIGNRDLVPCSRCGTVLGSWGELQDEFYRQGARGVFDLRDGQIISK